MTSPASSKSTCKNCNAELSVEPGTTELSCPYCGFREEIVATGRVEELDFHEYLRQAEFTSSTEEVLFHSCDGCGAQISVETDVHSDRCPYCGKSYVTKEPEHGKGIKPGSLLPFEIKSEDALSEYRRWVKKRWFAPNSFRQAAARNETLEGVYLPHWTFDCLTLSSYTGKRGDDYQTTETYTTTEDGKSVTKTRTVTKTRWTHTSGSVTLGFDDIITPASDSLPKKYVEKLEPWDLHALEPFNDSYLTGFRTERYSISLDDGFSAAKDEMESPIRSRIKSDIGGDHQRIDFVDTSYRNISFKHVLLPVWVTAYRFNDKAYRIVINARTGEVQGERPWSWVKITLFVIVMTLLIAGIIYFVDASGFFS